MWIVKTQHNSGSDVETKKAKNKADAIKKLEKFYKSYDFKLVDGVLTNEHGDSTRIHAVYNSKKQVEYFSDHEGEGPIGEIEKI